MTHQEIHDELDKISQKVSELTLNDYLNSEQRTQALYDIFDDIERLKDSL